MSSIKTMVIDDESIARRRIVKLLSRHDQFDLIEECSNGRDAYDAIIAQQPDVIFLDIEMPILSGIELVEKLPKENRPLIVFVTAYNNYAIEAFNFFALDYLLKPFTEDRFDNTIARIIQTLNKEAKTGMSHQLDSFLQFLNSTDNKSITQQKKLPISLGNKIYFIEIPNIQYVIADGNYVNIFANNTKHVLRETLNNFEKKLGPADFIRIHKSFIVNLDFIKEIKKSSNGSYQICMMGNQLFNISKTYRSEVMKKLKL